MPRRQPRTRSFSGRLSLALCLVLAGLLATLQARAAEILLTGAQDSPGIQSFTQALKALRPEDDVRFTPLASLPAADKLPTNIRLILLDLPSLDWRLQTPQGPATLVLRISRLQARERLKEAIPAHLSLLWSDPPVTRQLHLIRAILPQAKTRCPPG